MTDVDCREARRALGVYIVGAIDPAERALVDEHLGRCSACREELAGLAGLPALLGRVPRAEAELLAMDDAELHALDEPPPELLQSLLRQVAARRKARRWRLVVAAAAAVLVGLAAGAGLSQLIGAPPAGQQAEVASATDSATHVSAVVDYTPAGSQVAMRVRVSGIPTGTTCDFWVVNGAGHRSWAGSWTIKNGYQTEHWYPGSAHVAASSVRDFLITTVHGKPLLSIPAS
jgi:predicted anti-sigma-YlaC factor YlaD